MYMLYIVFACVYTHTYTYTVNNSQPRKKTEE